MRVYIIEVYIDRWDCYTGCVSSHNSHMIFVVVVMLHVWKVLTLWIIYVWFNWERGYDKIHIFMKSYEQYDPIIEVYVWTFSLKKWLTINIWLVSKMISLNCISLVQIMVRFLPTYMFICCMNLKLFESIFENQVYDRDIYEKIRSINWT